MSDSVLREVIRELRELRSRVATLEGSEYVATAGNADKLDGLHADATGTANAHAVATDASGDASVVDLTAAGGLNVGTATGAGTGDVKCSGNITAGPGVTAGSFVAASAGQYYVGDSVTDGSWRMGRSGDNLVFQRRVAGNWVTKSTIAA
jgi:hypothetical protein